MSSAKYTTPYAPVPRMAVSCSEPPPRKEPILDSAERAGRNNTGECGGDGGGVGGKWLLTLCMANEEELVETAEEKKEPRQTDVYLNHRLELKG